MKAFKLDLKSYKVKVRAQVGVEEAARPYDVKETIGIVMLHPSQKIAGLEFYKVSRVVQSIFEGKDIILLEKLDYDLLKKCFDKFVGFGRNDMELVRRVYEAKEVEVTEEKK